MKNILLLRIKPPVYSRSKHPIGCRPPYILKYAEALLKQEGPYHIKLIDQNIRNITLEGIRDIVRNWPADIVVISVSTLDKETSLDFCRTIRKESGKNAVIIGVGQAISVSPGDFKKKHYKEFDIVLAGEAEQELVKTIKSFSGVASQEGARKCYDQHNVKSDIFRVSELDKLPFPAYERDELNGYRSVYPLKTSGKVLSGRMLTSRGCPHNCVFCSQIIRDSYGKDVRRRSASNIVDEMEHLLKLGANMILVDDDNFTSAREHVKEVCGEIKKRGLTIRWGIHARVDEVDLSILRLLRGAGCMLIRFGIESGSERILRILKKTINSHEWSAKSREAVSAAKSLGMSVACLFIVGNPTETKEDLKKSIDLAKELSPDIIQVSYFTPFPGSEAYSLVSDGHGRFASLRMYHYEIPEVNLSSMSETNFRQAQKLFYKHFLLRPSFISRHFFDYFFFYITNPDVLVSFMRILPKIVRKTEQATGNLRWQKNI